MSMKTSKVRQRMLCKEMELGRLPEQDGVHQHQTWVYLEMSWERLLSSNRMLMADAFRCLHVVPSCLIGELPNTAQREISSRC